MVYVSPVIELIRARPGLVFWTAALLQALLWTLVPSLFYTSPPGDLPLVLAIGHEWQLGSWLGPPLAYWVAEIAFRLANSSIAGVYLLSQVCVVVTWWAVFTLARAIVGGKHGAIAVLLMAGIATFSVPTADFGPAVLAMPLTALALLHYWRAIAEDRPKYWIALGVDLGLLVLTTYAGVILISAMVAFTAATRRGRLRLRTSLYPVVTIPIILFIISPHLYWLRGVGFSRMIAFAHAPPLPIVILQWGWLLAGLALAHAGLVILAAVAAVRLPGAQSEVPVIERAPVGRFGKAFVYGFALGPVLAVTLAAAFAGQSTLATGAGPFLVLSALAIVLVAGDAIAIQRQGLVGWTWLALVLGPALLTLVAMVVLPWIGLVEVRTSEPGPAIGHFMTDSFNRRTGRPLAVVVGDARLGALVAFTSHDRPRLFIDAAPERAPWIRDGEIAEKGAVVVWTLSDPAGQPPPAIRARFPDLVPEVPQSFERAIQGRLPLLRIGWAVIRPTSVPPAAR